MLTMAGILVAIVPFVIVLGLLVWTSRQERRRHEGKSHFGGLVTSRSRNGHTPVTVPSDDVIRIAWRGRHDWVSPSLRNTLRQLQGRVRVGEATLADLSNLNVLSSEEIDRLTLELGLRYDF